MTRMEAFEIWAPPQRPWSNWVKPVLFANMNAQTLSPQEIAAPLPQVALPWLSGVTTRAAIVVDVPSSIGVAIALQLAEAGYQPVPLYNAAPGPAGQLPPLAPVSPLIPDPVRLPISMVDMRHILDALWFGAERLARVRLPANCPPVFLLDSRRRTGEGNPAEGRFDNRSISFPTDFPSANFLQTHAIRQAVLVQAEGVQPQSDLAHTLLRWQEGGIAVSSVTIAAHAPHPIRVITPSYFRWIWYRMLALVGLRRHELGGFGGMIPEASAG